MSYEQKYLKYKHKYQELKQKLSNTHEMQSNVEIHDFILTDTPTIGHLGGGAPEYTLIPAGSFIFRCAPSIGDLKTYDGRLANVKTCMDTGKTGLYFANVAIIALAMCIEYDTLMEFGIFNIVSNIEPVIKGKYAFRQINPERYFEEDGSMIQNVVIVQEENVSHMECNLNLLGSPDTLLLPDHIQSGLNCLGSCELFLSTLNPDHLRNVELVSAFKFNSEIIRTAKDLHDYMVKNHYPFDLQKYIDDKVIIQFM